MKNSQTSSNSSERGENQSRSFLSKGGKITYYPVGVNQQQEDNDNH